MTNGYKDKAEQEFDERIINIERVAAVVKGGRRFPLRVTMVAGDHKGRVGIGMGKAKSVPDAIRKAASNAKDDMHPVAIYDTGSPSTNGSDLVFAFNASGSWRAASA